MNKALFWREMRGSLGLLVIFGGVLTLYIVMIAGLYDKETQQALQQFYDMMPQLMAAVGMNGEGDTLLSFLSTYLYGMLLLAFPMVYAILRARGLVARYVEKGSMYALCAAPVSRLSLAGTQLAVLVSTQFGLLLYCSGNCILPGALSRGAGHQRASVPQRGAFVSASVPGGLLLSGFLPGGREPVHRFDGRSSHPDAGDADAGQSGRKTGKIPVCNPVFPVSAGKADGGGRAASCRNAPFAGRFVFRSGSVGFLPPGSLYIRISQKKRP